MHSSIKVQNKNGWDELTKKNYNILNTSLPQYGPYCKSENELHLINIKDHKILEIGCGSGDGIEYLVDHNVREAVGIDISNERIKKAKLKNLKNSKFYCRAMEDYLENYTDYFNYVILIYSIGYTSDLDKTFTNIYNYLKVGGKIIFSWTHPFFENITLKNNQLYVNSEYKDYTRNVIKGNGVELVMQINRLSTIINKLIQHNFEIECIVEEKSDTDNVSFGNSNFYNKQKTNFIPGTIIYVATKKDKSKKNIVS